MKKPLSRNPILVIMTLECAQAKLYQLPMRHRLWKKALRNSILKFYFMCTLRCFFYNQYFKNGLFIDIWNKYLTSMVVGYRCASPRITQFRNPDIFAYNAFHLRESASLDSKSSSWMICIERSRNISAWIFTYLKQFLQSFSVVVGANLFSQNKVQKQRDRVSQWQGD